MNQIRVFMIYVSAFGKGLSITTVLLERSEPHNCLWTIRYYHHTTACEPFILSPLTFPLSVGWRSSGYGIVVPQPLGTCVPPFNSTNCDTNCVSRNLWDAKHFCVETNELTTVYGNKLVDVLWPNSTFVARPTAKNNVILHYYCKISCTTTGT